jgi:signal transduction histidine kinase
MTKDMVERGFHGSIQVESTFGSGTTFTVEFPQRRA